MKQIIVKFYIIIVKILSTQIKNLYMLNITALLKRDISYIESYNI
jgi:hypothetical protein